MTNRDNDILDEYAKIAIERGLISTAATDQNEKNYDGKTAPKDSPALKRYKKSPYPRAGSDSADAIALLYNVKPDSDYKYEHNIEEVAHKEPVIISPAYDRVNGLVESDNERQAILINILTPPNNGNLTQHRYAQKEMLMELIRIANDLDIRGENEDLRKLADHCIETISGELESGSAKKKLSDSHYKVAFNPLFMAAPAAAAASGAAPAAALAAIFEIGFWPLTLGIATVMGATWLYNHINDVDLGLRGNIARAMKALDDLKTNSWYESDVDSEVQQIVESLETKLMALEQKFGKFNYFMTGIHIPNNTADLTNDLIDSGKENGSAAKNATNEFVNTINILVPEIEKDIELFTNKQYQLNHTNPSAISRMTGWVGEIMHGRWGLMGNDFISAVNALSPLDESLKAAKELVNGKLPQVQKSMADKVQEQLEQAKEKMMPGQKPSSGNNSLDGEDEDAEMSFDEASKLMTFK